MVVKQVDMKSVSIGPEGWKRCDVLRETCAAAGFNLEPATVGISDADRFWGYEIAITAVDLMAGKLPSRARDTYACNLYVLATRRAAAAAAVGTPRILSTGGEINFRRFFFHYPGIAESPSTFRVANRMGPKTFFPVRLLCFPSGPATEPSKKNFLKI